MDMILQFTAWIEKLKQQTNFNSALDFFIKTAGFPILYFEYCFYTDKLFLKNSALVSVNSKLAFYFYESDKSFDISNLYQPKKIFIFHKKIKGILGSENYQSQPLVFNNQIKGLFVYLPPSSLAEQQFFILNNYLKNFLWTQKWEKEKSLDELTGCLNYKNFMRQLFMEVSKTRRLKLPLSLLLLKLDLADDLKSSYGTYKTGTLIKALVRYLSTDSRPYDIFGSWEGQYIAITLPHTSQAFAIQKAEKIRHSIQVMDFSKVFAHHFITVSICVGSYPQSAESAFHLFQVVKTALTDSHSKYGRNVIITVRPRQTSFTTKSKKQKWLNKELPLLRDII